MSIMCEVESSTEVGSGSPGTRCAAYGGTCVFSIVVGEWLCGVGWCSIDPHCVIVCGTIEHHDKQCLSRQCTVPQEFVIFCLFSLYANNAELTYTSTDDSSATPIN
jgi:hypothetical protein